MPKIGLDDIKRLLGGAGGLVKRGSTEAAETALEEVPEVIGKGKSKLSKAASEAIEVPFKEITPTTGMDDMSFLNRMDPRLRKFGAGAAAGAGAGYLASKLLPPEELFGGDQSEEMAKIADLPKVEQPEVAKEAAKAQTSAVEQIAGGIAKEAKQATPEEAANYLEEFKQAQAAQGDYDIAALIAQAGNDISRGLGAASGLRDKADYSLADFFTAQGKKKVSDVTAKMSMDKLQKELDDETKLRDPNSDASIATRQVLAKHGINVKTAKEAKDAGLNIQNILLQEMAHKKALEVAEKSAATKTKNQEEKDRKFIQGLRKEATTGVLGKQYSTYSTGERMKNALEEFAKNPSGYKDYATLMGGLKALQGDESVVREAEVRLGMSATSAIDALYNQLQKAATGKMLTEGQRKEMISTIKTLTDASRQQYMQAVQPILEQAQLEGVDPRLVLSGSLSGVSKQEESSAQYSPKEEAGIAAFMQAKGIDRAEAVKRLKAGGRLK